jgi:3-oxoacyl-[acyl-carrier-protein] synthase II
MAIGEAYRLIKDGYMDRVIVGGLDYNCNQNVIPGMDAFGALCTTHNNSPEDACMPFDINRSGTVVSDGGAMILLESEEFAHKRKAKQIYGEVIGYGQTNDATSIMRPEENGLGILAAVMAAINDAGIHPLDIDAVNCHARSTVAGDPSEAYCLHSLFACGNQIKSSEEFAKLAPEEVNNYYDKGLPET